MIEVYVSSGERFAAETLEEARALLEQDVDDCRGECDPEWPTYSGEGYAKQGERVVLRQQERVTHTRPAADELDDEYDEEGRFWGDGIEKYVEFDVVEVAP